MLSSRATTAIRFVQALAKLPPSATRSLQDLSIEENLPHAYLEQIIPDLKKANIVSSTRGAYGGYRISQAATKPITALSVFQAVEPPPSGPIDALNSQIQTMVKNHLATILLM